MRIFYCAFALAAIAGASFAQTKDVAIKGIRIEIGDGKVIASGTVLIHDGKIAAVGENVTVPPGVDVVDGTGKTLFPGFIDAYSTRGIKIPDAPTMGTPPDSRTTAPPTMWHGNRKGIRSDILASKCLDIKDQLSDNYAQGITTALLSAGTGTIRGIATIVDYTDPGSVLVPSAAAEVAIRGGGFGGAGGGNNNGDQGYPGSLLGIVALARQTLVDAQQYAANPPEKKDDALENLKPLMTKQIPVLFTADNEREIVRCGRIGDEFGFKMLFANAHDAYKQIPMLKAKGAAILVSIDSGAEPPVTPAEGLDGTPKEVLEERHQIWVDRSFNVKKLSEAEVPFAFSTVGANLSDYLKNVRKLVAGGVPRESALKAMTSGAAAILGIGDKTGSIEVGKQANLVLMNGDFIDGNAEVQTVFVEGKKIDVKKGTSK